VGFYLLFGYVFFFSVTWSYLLSIQVSIFLLYVYDKMSAKNSWLRVPEWSLHILAILGGSPAGYLAQKILRHKSIDRTFQPVYKTIIVLQVLALIGYYYVR